MNRINSFFELINFFIPNQTKTGKRLPRIRPPVAGQSTPVYIKRSGLALNETLNDEQFVPHTNYEFVNQIMHKLKNNNANDILHSTQSHVPQDLLYAIPSKVSSRRSSSSFTYSTPTTKQTSFTPRATSKYLSLKERFTPLINRFGKQKRALVVMNKIQNLVRNFSNMTTYSFKSIEKKYPEFGQFNEYYEHILQNQNYDEKDMQQILINLEKLLLQDKVNHQLHNEVFNNEFNSTNDELLEAINSFNILNAS